MTKVSHLTTLKTAVPREALGALWVCSGLRPAPPSEWDASQSTLNSEVRGYLG